jgi:peptidoglycan/xylan/chitin deacetylase (PgdA/CDA1 family)
MMRIPGLKTLRRGLWMARGGLFGGGAVLGYHRVANDPADPWSICVDPGTFDAHMAVLRRDFRPVPLAAMEDLRPSRRGRLPVAVTFDDGYADVLTQALPILERHDVPATAFVVPGALSGCFWWDRLRRILEQPALPHELELTIAGTDVRWSATASGGSLADLLHSTLHSMPGELRDAALHRLAEWAGVEDTVNPETPVLSAHDLDVLGKSPLVEIGSHTMNHLDLRVLSASELDHEVRGSRERLRDMTGKDIESFSFPHGLFGSQSVASVTRAGFRRACTSASGLVQRGTDPFRIPRLWAPLSRDVDFRRWMRGWTGH